MAYYPNRPNLPITPAIAPQAQLSGGDCGCGAGPDGIGLVPMDRNVTFALLLAALGVGGFFLFRSMSGGGSKPRKRTRGNPRKRIRRVRRNGDWSEMRDPEAYEAAMDLARGDYQRALIAGDEALSGSTLRGKAKRYSARYQQSARSLLKRLTDHGIPWSEKRGPRGRRTLVIG